MSTGGLSALAWLAVVGLRNQVMRRLRRLKDPKYVVALAVGLLYFLWIFGPWSRSDGDDVSSMLPPELVVIAPFIIVVLVVFWWLWGGYQKALALTPSEIAMLVPAPLTRRQLIQFKLLKAQVGVVFTGALISILVLPGPLPWYLRFAGVWVMVTTLHLHQIAASLARTGALGQGRAGVQRLGVPLGIALLALTALWWSVMDVWPVVRSGGLEAGLEAFVAALQRPVPQLVLLPFAFILDPVTATSTGEWLRAMPAALVVMGLHYIWLMRMDTAFEEAAAEAGRIRAERLAAFKAGRRVRVAGAREPAGWRRRLPLAPTGSPAIAVLWKNTLAAIGEVRPTTLVVLGGGLGAIGGALWLVTGSLTNTADGLAMLSAIVFGIVTFFGPLVIRADLRRDLEAVELLKTFPIRGLALVAAEVGASTLALAGMQVVVLAIGLAALPFSSADAVGIALAPVAAIAALVLLLPVNGVLVAIQNALALLFPAWSRIGADHPGGVEHMGRMILTAAGTAATAAVTLVPALGLGALAGVVVAGPLPVRVLVGAVVTAVVLAIELALLVTWLGTVYDALDPVDAGLLRH